ncbi:MAG: restriction endonuclease subunit S [Armatimonadota bacterium]|nr:restriction endonuclease subunit S [Armatimonadota bacterium]
MGGEWREVRFGDIAETLPGKYLPASEYDPNGAFLIYGSNSVMGRAREYLYEGPIIVLARIGSNCGATMFSAAPCWINNNAAGIRGRPGTDTRFLFYWLQSFDFSLIREGSGQPFISQRALDGQIVRLPPLPEQRAIAHILGTLDDKIELNRKMSETLEAMARAIFKAWFVDFEPVRAKMEGRWRRGQSLPGLPARLYDLFPDRLVPSELGEIPEGWGAGTLGDFVELLRDQENPLESPDVRFLHFSIPAFDEGQSPKEELGKTIKSVKFRVSSGVILLSKLNPEVERVWLVDIPPNSRAVCSTEFLVFRPRPPVGRSFVYCHYRSPVFRQQLEALVTGTSKSHQRAQAASVLGLAAARPPGALAEAFEQVGGPLLERSLECRRESRTLAALRDALLPKLICGELRVKDAERFLKARGL